MRLLSKPLLPFLLLTAVLLLPASLHAQLSMRMEINQQSFLQFENVYAKITLRNFSGHPLIFGQNKELQGNLSFYIIGPDGRIVGLKGEETPPLTGLLLEPGQSKDIVVEVSKYYPLFEVGRYTIRAIISHPQLASRFQSNTASITVSKGLLVWEHIFGVPQLIPDPNKINDKIPERTYKIYSLYDGAKNYFYLVVEDKNYIYGLHRIGVEMSRNTPACEVDRLSRIHILVPTNPRIFTYFVFDPSGAQEKRTVYRKTTTVPTLVRNPVNGSVVIAGGEEARRDVDYQDDPGTRPTVAESPEIKAGNPPTEGK